MARFTQWKPKNGQSPLSWVISQNLNRRHLTPSQASACATDSQALLDAEKRAKERQREGGKKSGRGMAKKVVEKIPQPIKHAPKSRDEAAELFNVNPRYVSDAKKI